MKYIVLETLPKNLDLSRLNRAIKWLEEDGFGVLTNPELKMGKDVLFTLSTQELIVSESKERSPLNLPIEFALEAFAEI